MNEEDVEKRVRERIAEVVDQRTAKLKTKYREQALKAVEDAERKGVERGKLEANAAREGSVNSTSAKDAKIIAELQEDYKQAKDDCKRYKAVADFVWVSSNKKDVPPHLAGYNAPPAESGPNSAPLVKYVDQDNIGVSLVYL